MKPCIKDRLVCICRDGHVRVLEIQGKDIKEAFCTNEQLKAPPGMGKVDTDNQIEAKSADGRSPQATSKSINVLTSDGAHFIYKSKANKFICLDIAREVISDLMDCRHPQGIEDICYSANVLFLLWNDHYDPRISCPNSLIAESWVMNEQSYRGGLLTLKNIKPLAFKDIIEKHSLLVYSKGNTISLMAMDHLLKGIVQTKFSLEADRPEEEIQILGKTCFIRQRITSHQLRRYQQANILRRSLSDLSFADPRFFMRLLLCSILPGQHDAHVDLP